MAAVDSPPAPFLLLREQTLLIANHYRLEFNLRQGVAHFHRTVAAGFLDRLHDDTGIVIAVAGFATQKSPAGHDRIVQNPAIKLKYLPGRLVGWIRGM